jgi:hypothetical protein
MFRFSLASLLFLTLVAGVGCAALANAGPVWTGVAATAVWLVLGVSLTAAFLWRGERQAYAVGAAVFAWLYFMTALSGLFPLLALELPTTTLLNWLSEKRQASGATASSAGWVAADEHFVYIG